MLQEYQLKTTLDHGEWQVSREHESTNPLHLRTQSQNVATSGGLQNDTICHQEYDLDRTSGREEHVIPPPVWVDFREASHGPQRHNSCPALPPLNVTPLPLRPKFPSPSDTVKSAMERTSRKTPVQATTPVEGISFHASQRFSQATETSPYASFIPQRMVPLPMSSIAEIAPGFSPTIQGGVGREQRQIRQPLVIYPSHSTVSSTLTPMVEHMSMDSWNGYTSGERLG
jgi:hypothetical protein